MVNTDKALIWAASRGYLRDGCIDWEATITEVDDPFIGVLPGRPVNTKVDVYTPDDPKLNMEEVQDEVKCNPAQAKKDEDDPTRTR